MNLKNPDLDYKLRLEFLTDWNELYPELSKQGLGGMIIFRGGQVYLERDGEYIIKLCGLSSASILGSDEGKSPPNKVLLSGDWVECRGEQNGDQLLLAEIILLSPNLHDNGHCAEVPELVKLWAAFLVEVSQFFAREGFFHLNTPTLVACPGTEPFLEPFVTEFKAGSKTQKFYLPTSPELHLKKCLAKGWDKIYEIRPCFRNGEISPIHQPEFFMLEWYRAFASIEKIQDDLKRLVVSIDPKFTHLNWVHKSMAELFRQYLDFELHPLTTMTDLIELACSHDVDVSSATDFDDAFFFLFLEKIEPQLKNYDCLFLHSYPPSQAALARLNSEGWGDRFEFYIRGMEVANAFNELNNPRLQRLRSLEDLEKKKLHGRSPIELDEEFFVHLEGGMPPSCGIALGLERLFMGIHNIEQIECFRLFHAKN